MPPTSVQPSIPRQVLSGIQPTGNLHIGNYFGAIVNWVDLQNTEHVLNSSRKVLYSIVDLHAITVPQDPVQLAANCRTMTAALLACGISKDKSAVFIQSHVSGHSELAWLLGTLTPISFLQRMTQYKDKVQKGQDSNSRLGLFSYPVLMSADVLLYRATHVPVGDDQVQHLELCRDIAGFFNTSFCKNEQANISSKHESISSRKKQMSSAASLDKPTDAATTNTTNFFPYPTPVFSTATRVMSLRDGLVKMSKSDASAQTRIELTDSDDDIRSKIMKSKTDLIAGVSYNAAERPEVSNLCRIYAATVNAANSKLRSASSSSSSVPSSTHIIQPPPSFPLLTPDAVPQEFHGKSLKEFKTALADVLVSHLGPIRGEIRRIHQDQQYISSVLREGAEYANEIAEENMKQIRQLMGFVPK
jgi:tryptophanyl-tRNA synthetase